MTRERSPALIASLALHLAVLAATLFTWPWTRELKVGAAVPVNLVSNAPTTDLRQAIQADDVQEAQTEDPVADAPPPEPIPPAPQPAPAPALRPAPTPKAAPPKATQPAPKRPAPKTEASSADFLDSLAADVAKLSKTQKASGARGPTRAETAREARPNLGDGLSASAVAGLADELQRRWNPNCEVEGGRDVRVRVTFILGPGGRVLGAVSAGGQERSSDPVVKAAAERAIRAVYQAQPFTRLPREFQGSPIAVNFNAREACS